MKGYRWVDVDSFLTGALARCECLTSRSSHFTPSKETPYWLSRDLGGPQNRSGRLEEEKNFLSLKGFEFRTFQLVSWVYRLRYYSYLTMQFFMRLGTFQGTVYRFCPGTEANQGRAAGWRLARYHCATLDPLPKELTTCFLWRVLKNLCSGNLPLFFSEFHFKLTIPSAQNFEFFKRKSHEIPDHHFPLRNAIITKLGLTDYTS